MRDEELRAARKWMKEWADIDGDQPAIAERRGYARTILRRLDMPVCPRGSEVPDDVIAKMVKDFFASERDSAQSMRDVIDILRAHLTAPPKAKREEGWLVIDGCDRASFTQKAVALAYAKDRPGSRLVRLVEVADADQ